MAKQQNFDLFVDKMSPMKSPTFVKQGLLGLFWWEESSNRALFVKLLWVCPKTNNVHQVPPLFRQKWEGTRNTYPRDW